MASASESESTTRRLVDKTVYSVGVIAAAIFLILLLVGLIIAVSVICCRRRRKALKSGKEGLPLRDV